VAIECDDFQMALLVNRAEYKKHTTLECVSSKMPFNISYSLFKITSLNLSPWHAIHSCNPDGKFTITAQRHTVASDFAVRFVELISEYIFCGTLK